MTEPGDLIKQLRSLKPGERILYYIGFLDELRMRRPPPREVIIANVAYELYCQDRVLLTQKRLSAPITSKGSFIDWKLGIGKGFEYWATGKTPKEPSK